MLLGVACGAFLTCLLTCSRAHVLTCSLTSGRRQRSDRRKGLRSRRTMRGTTPSSARAARQRRHDARGGRRRGSRRSGGVVGLPRGASAGTLLRRGEGASHRRSVRQPRWRAGLGSRMSLRPRSWRASPQGCARPRRGRGRGRGRGQGGDTPRLRCLRLDCFLAGHFIKKMPGRGASGLKHNVYSIS